MDLLELARTALPLKTSAAGEHRRWRVSMPGREPFTVSCTPPADAAHMTTLYLGATVQPLPERESTRVATPREVAELANLIARALRDEPAQQAEVLSIALRDVDAALQCYRSMADHSVEAHSASVPEQPRISPAIPPRGASR